jgi:cobalamin biosynthesis Co2+ chelatase CbiK
MQCSLLHKSGLTKQTTARKEKQAKKFNQSKLGRDFTSYQIIKKIRKKKRKRKKAASHTLKRRGPLGKSHCVK